MKFPLTLVLAAVGVSVAAGQTAVVPTDYTSSAATSTFLGPYANAARTYQLLIHSDQLTALVGQRLTGLTWRLPASATAAWPATTVSYTSYDIYLSGSVAPADRSLTFASNVVGPQTQVRSGGLTIDPGAYPSGGNPNEFGPTVAFDPWVYEGGHLLVELRHSGFTGTSRSVEAVGTAASTGYGTQFSAAWTGSYTGLTGTQGNFAVTRFDFAPVPEPAGLLAVAAGAAGWLAARRRAVIGFLSRHPTRPGRPAHLAASNSGRTCRATPSHAAS